MKKQRFFVALIIALGALLGGGLYLWAQNQPEGAAETLDKRITATPIGGGDADRRQILLDFDTFIAENIPTAVKPQTEATKLLELRTTRAIEEIRGAEISEGELRVWYIYNMGIVVKTWNTTIGIDVAGTYETPSIEEVGSLLDVLIITHPHSDHLDSKVAAAAAKAGAKIVVADEKVSLDGSNVVRDPSGTGMVELLTGSKLAADALVGVKPGETIVVDGVKITAIPATHTSTQLDTPVDWFYIEASGFCVLHTGDGYFPDTRPDLTAMRVDLYLIHYVDEVFAEDYYELAPQSRVMVPLHLHELGHGEDILSYAMYGNALEQEKGGHLWLEHMTPPDTGIRYLPMLWGEAMSLTP